MRLFPADWLWVSPTLPRQKSRGERVGCVHIPLSELGSRQHELPPPYRLLRLSGSEARDALSWFQAQGRRALTVPAPPLLHFGDKEGRYRLWEPNEYLQVEVAGMPPGRALDLACGSGREAVYLAAEGWQVVAVDHLPDALARGAALQARYAPEAPPIQWIQADLESEEWQPEGTFDLILCFFFLNRPLLRRIPKWLSKGGRLLVETFTETHRASFGRPSSERWVLRPNELPQWVHPLQVIDYSEAWRTSGRHTARLKAIRGEDKKG